MSAWTPDDIPDGYGRISAIGYVVAILRGLPMALVVFGGLGVHLLVRFFERPLFGMRRPLTPFITQGVCRISLFILGVKYVVKGRPMVDTGAVVANHASWIDIFALNAAQRIYFVSKAEVAGWPGIGWLARATGTVFIKRDRSEAAKQKQMFLDRLSFGHKLLFFPEGTSTDGLRVLPFKPTLLAAFFEEEFRDKMKIQPVSLHYTAPKGADQRFYGWWGDMDFGTHLLMSLSQIPQGTIEVVFHAPHDIAEYESRKHMAAALRDNVCDEFFDQFDRPSP